MVIIKIVECQMVFKNEASQGFTC